MPGWAARAATLETGGLTQPTIEPEAEGLGMAARRRAGRWYAAPRWLRIAVISVAALAAVPVVLTLLYLLPFVHPISTLMLKDLVTLQGYDRQWVDLEDIAPVAVHSVIMSEDGQFCSHYGVDLGEMKAEIDDLLAGRPARGASTIPMQAVKNLYLWHGRSFLRKALEAPLAIGFDLVVPKRRIMEIYLNIVEWGPNVYGIEAASQYHFGKPAKDLTRRQAALLAVALPNPIERDPGKPGPGLKRLASIVERRASRAGGYVDCVE
ncbi:MAG: monofunctional biosynthetic peptidoglycan transglycosylase [Rhizobiaceae bacterium]|nr:monofunctional biosynthetic peptidoglycan transglycosylase [Rhizobiaceae bacterium]